MMPYSKQSQVSKSNPGCGCGNTAIATGSQCGNACGPSQTAAISCGPSVVQGNALAQPNGPSTLSFNLTDCRPNVYITCPSKKFFEVDPDTRLIFFYDFSTCTFADDPSPGGCPTSYAIPYAIQDEDGDYHFLVDLPDGTYEIEQGQSGDPPVFTLVPCPPASCFRAPLKWEGVTLVFTGPLTISDLDVAASLTNCGA